jgi:murein DD-endopeptidase MepM/ murein hydrolase activator NlpD
MTPAPMVLFNDAANISLSYGGTPAQQSSLATGWTRFQQPDPATLQRFEIGSRFTYSQPGQVMAEYRLPAGVPDGLYRIEAFLPGQRATVRDAQYRVAHNFRSENGSDVCDETLVTVNQGYHYDHWVPLGWFRLAPSAHPLNGRVRLSNYSSGAKSWIAFGPLRWVHIPDDQESQLYDPPVGTPEERVGPLLENVYQFVNKPRWLPGWYDYTPFLEWYALGCHPGVDLNSTISPAADKGAPVFSIADGIVIFAGAAGSWGTIVVIWHPDALVTLPDGTVQRQHVYARYGHLANLMVQTGVHVQRGQPIGKIGLMAGATAGWHLHFDLSFTEKLRQVPSYWTAHRNRPRFEVRREVLANYLDPFVFMRDNHKLKIVESKG